MRKLFYIDLRRNIKLMFCLLFLFIPIRYANSASYTLMSVGESLTVSQTTYMGGYISKVALAATLDAHLSFRDNGVGEAVITVNSYFNYETTVKLVFVERYQSYYSGRIHNLSHTYYKDVPIRCKYQAPDPSKKPKKVKLPERVRVPLGERVTVEPVLEPYGAVATSSSWDFDIPWTTCHTYLVENSINCQLFGMKLGYGEATITINGDENLRASTIIEVVDPNSPSPDNIIIPDTVEVSVGKICTISPLMVPEGTSTAMSWYSDNTSIATVEAGRITGKKEGETYVYYRSLYDLRDTCVVRVVKQNGMNDDSDAPSVMGVIDGHEYVDLGLNILWASRNVGATSIFDVGDKFAWSETEPKADYTEGNYTGSKKSGNFSIQGTNQDAAYVQWGSAWRMPTTDQFTELFGKCSFNGVAINGEGFIVAEGNNGATAYFSHGSSSLWTANPYTGMMNVSTMALTAYVDLLRSAETALRYNGMPVRAVSSVNPADYGKKPTAISLSAPVTVKITDTFVPKYTITPIDATTPLMWYSENSLIASVSPVGVVKAVGVGTTKIWIETANGLKASCDVTVEGISKIEQVFTGPFCNFFLDETGTLWGCGLNSFGILNDGKSKNEYLSPKVVMHDVVQVSVGSTFSNVSLITKKDGTLWSAGSSTSGLLDKSNSSRFYYKKVMDDVAITARGDEYSYILKKDGSLCRSYKGSTPTILTDNVKSLSGGEYHALVIKNDGTLWTCGENKYGQLGDGTTTDSNAKLIKIADDVKCASAGLYHSLFVKNDGTLWGCGSNTSGQLGDGIGESTNTPVKIMDNVRSATAGSSHTLVIKNDDTLWGFGSNSAGQLGNGTTENISTPIKIMDNVVSAYAGSSQSFFIKKDGSLWGCGGNTRGELGDGSGESRTRPVKIIGGDAVDVSISVSPSSKTINVGDGFYCTYTISPANASSQTSVTWSSDDSSIASVSSSGYVTGKKAGTTYINATTANGKTARCKVTVETNNIKVTGISISTPTSMTEGGTQQLTATVSPSNATNKSVTWSSSNTSVATVSGAGLVTAKSAGTVTITCSASDGSGVKATCSITVSATPVDPAEPGILKMNVKQIALGHNHSLIVETDGTLWVCGYNNRGQLGDGTTIDRKTPVKVMTDVAQVSTGWAHSVILKTDGILWACGFNKYGQLGDGTTTDRDTLVKVMSDVAQVSAGQEHTMILKTDGTLWGCGYNIYGQLGNGSIIGYTQTPVYVMNEVSQVFTGYNHTLILKVDGSLWACGNNNNGQLGDGTTTKKSTPVKVMTDVAQVSVGNVHSMMLKTDGSLWACGSNSYGNLGDGTTTNKSTPVKVMTGVAQVSAGRNHTMILKTDGTLWACGFNEYGQLGDGTTTDRDTLVKVMTDVAQVYAGGYRTMLLKTDGTLWACGDNTNGKLGDGTTTDRTSFVKIAEPNIMGDEITVKTSDAGYATFYSAKSAYNLPRNLSAQVVTNASNQKLTYKTIADGSVSGVIPAGTAVMLVSDDKQAGTYTLTSTESKVSYSGTNLLRGSDAATTTTGDGYHYKLSYGQPGSNLSNVFGWYWGAQNGAPFQIEGHKAWLVVPKSSSSTRGFAIGGEATGIEMVSGDDDVEADAVYYDLQGRRVTKPTVKGVYIKNGKKVMVK